MSRLLTALLAGALLLPALVRAETPKPEFFDRAFSSQEAMESLTPEERDELSEYLNRKGLEESGFADFELVAVSLDAEGYESGEVASVAIAWNSRALRGIVNTDDIPMPKAEISLFDSEEKPCSPMFAANLSDFDTTIPVDVTGTCRNPAVKLSVSESDGEAIGEWIITDPIIRKPVDSVESASQPLDGSNSVQGPWSVSGLLIALVVALFTVSIVLILVFRNEKGNRRFGILLMPVLVALTTFLSFATPVWAENFSFTGRYARHELHFPHGLIYPGGSVLYTEAEMYHKDGSLEGSQPGQNRLVIRLTASTNGQTRLLTKYDDERVRIDSLGIRGGALFNLPTTPGIYPIDFSDCTEEYAYRDDGTEYLYYSGCKSYTVDLTITEPLPRVNLSAYPGSVSVGETSTLSWSSSATTSCSASGDWSGAKSLSGSESTGAIDTAKEYRITCQGNAGTATDTANVSILTPPADPLSLSFVASPATIEAGQSSTLSWDSENVDFCWASTESQDDFVEWDGEKAISGAFLVYPESDTTYSLACYNESSGESIVREASILVSSPVTSDHLSLCDGSIRRNDSSVTMAEGDTKSLTLRYGSNNDCSDPNVTSSEKFSENDPNGYISLSGSDPITLSADRSGSAAIMASHDGEDASLSVNVISNETPPGGGSTSGSSRNMNWREVAPGE